jgi:hypothetical protein
VTKTCIFCRQKVTSVEHAWPQWLLKSVGGFDSQSETEAQFGAESEEVRWIGPEVTVKCVCKKCNNGWMSKLEVEAKPVLASLINDLALPLGGADAKGIRVERRLSDFTPSPEWRR